MKPLVKWPGGKTWAIQLFGAKLLTLTAKNYCEPFLGSGAMALFLAQKKAFRVMTLGDIEPPLMHMYMVVREQPKEVAQAMKQFIDFGTDEKSYYAIREVEPQEFPRAAARFIYLNKLCYNGLYRVNKSGKFNVPYGKNPHRKLPKEEDFLQFSELMKNASFFIKDFEELIARANQNYFLYVDPPYYGSFSSYTKGKFSFEDQERLAEALCQAAKRGAQIVAHNADAEEIRSLYRGWLEEIPVFERWIVNRDGKGRSDKPCVVLTNVSDLFGDSTRIQAS